MEKHTCDSVKNLARFNFVAFFNSVKEADSYNFSPSRLTLYVYDSLRTTTEDKRNTNVFTMYTMYTMFYRPLIYIYIIFIYKKGVGGRVFFLPKRIERDSCGQNLRISSHGSPRFSARDFDFIFKIRNFRRQSSLIPN
jgi:hypothetical protein